MQPRETLILEEVYPVAWNIVQHAFKIVFGNLRYALRASIIPFLIMMVVLFVLAKLLGLPLYLDPTAAPPAGLEAAISVYTLVSIPFYLFIFGWIAVTWHRYILLEEYPRTVPEISNRPIGAYVGRTLMMILQLIVAMIPVFMVVMLIVGVLFGAQGPEGLQLDNPSGFSFGIIVGTLMTYLWFRIGVSLPAVAIGKPMNSREAWQQTAPVWQTLLGVSAILALLNLAVTLVFSQVFAGIPIVSYVINVAIQWATMMIGVSVLTTIYGHVVEGRPLAGN